MRNIALFLFIVLLPTSLMAKKREPKTGTEKWYSQKWKEVEAFEKDLLPRSADSVATIIHNISIKQKNTQQAFKSIVVSAKFRKEFSEDFYPQFYTRLTDEIKSSWQPYAQLLHQTAMQCIAQYIANNHFGYEYSDSAANVTAADNKNDTYSPSTLFTQMDKQQLLKTMLYHSKKSTENQSLLAKISPVSFSQIIEKGNRDASLLPTLWDMLAWQVVAAYRDNASEFSDYNYSFDINNPALLSSEQAFTNFPLSSKDTLDINYQICGLLQKILKFRLSRPSENEALIDADLTRIVWVDSENQGNSDTLVFNALDRLLQKAQGLPIWSLVQYQKAYKLYNANNSKLNYYTANNVNQYDAESQLTNDEFLKLTNLLNQVVEMLQQGINAAPDSQGGVKCKQLLTEITSPYISIHTESFYHPNISAISQVSFKNCNDFLTGYIIPIPNNSDENANYTLDSLNYLISNKNKIPIKIEIPQFKDYRTHTVDFQLPKLSSGKYLLAISNHATLTSQNEIALCEFNISKLCATATKVSASQFDVHVMDRANGNGIAGAKITASVPGNEKKQIIAYTDTSGHALPDGLPQSYRYIFEISQGDDYFKLDTYAGRYSEDIDSDAEKKNIELNIFKDRKIYRPGQTVYYKAILMQTNGKQAQVMAKQPVQLTLRDYNGNDVASADLTTNEFGSCSGLFTIPAGAITGEWSIISQFGTTSLNVEEYKRPKFSVELLPPTTIYQLGDSLTIIGKATAFTGASVSGSKIKFSVIRTYDSFIPIAKVIPWDKIYTKIVSGEFMMNDNGNFEIKFGTSPFTNEIREAQSFNINVAVVDINGETQEKEFDITVSNQRSKIVIEAPKFVQLTSTDSLTLKIDLQNRAGISQANKINYQIYRLTEKGELKTRMYWNSPEVNLVPDSTLLKFYYPDKPQQTVETLLETGVFDTSASKLMVVKNTDILSDGLLKFVFKTDSDNVKEERLIEVYRHQLGSTVSPNPLSIHLVQNNESNDNVTAIISSAIKTTQCYLEIYADDKCIKNEVIALNHQYITINIPLKDVKRPLHITAKAYIINYNRSYIALDQMDIENSDAKLSVNLETFRDKLQPGTTETVKFHIDKYKSELLASMYDASLDQFKANNWYFNLFQTRYFYFHNHIDGFKVTNGWCLNQYGNFVNEEYFDSNINWFSIWDNNMLVVKFSQDRASNLQLESSLSKSESRVGVAQLPSPPVRNGIRYTPPVIKHEDKIADDVQKEQPKAGALNNVAVRRSLQETAFFYPHLTTDANGNISFTYTVPESLTQWRFMALAHDKEGRTGQIERFVTTSKELMVVPEIPRFLREGDELTFVTKIVNLTKNNIKASASLEILDAYSLKTLKGCENLPIRQLAIVASNNSTAEWLIKVPQGIDAAIIRVKAASSKHSDGEEQLIPVLPSRVLVNETLPFFLTQKGKEVLHLHNLEKSGQSDIQQHRLTFSYTQQAAWEIIKSLPYLMEYPYECSEQVFSRLFGYAAGQTLINNYPSIKKALELWDFENKNGGKSLVSPLLKNEFLKQLISEETPWEQAGENETANRRRLLVLLNTNQVNDNIATAINKLEELQSDNGGWVWFKGMETSPYLTAHILTGFGQLKRMGSPICENPNITRMMAQSLNYLKSNITDQWKQIKKDTTQQAIDYNLIQLLYALSFHDQTSDDSGFTATRDSLITRMTNLQSYPTIIEQAMAAVTLHRIGHQFTAKKLMASILQKEVRTDNNLIWFKRNNSWRWVDNGIETQAVVIDALNEIWPKHPHLSPMQNWLVMQKRAQAWPTTRSTVMAAAGMMSSGFYNDNYHSDIISVGNVNVSALASVKREAITGNYSMTWEKAEIKPSMGNITINKTENTPSWGFLKWQYFTSIANVKATGDMIKVNRILLVEKIIDGQTKLLPVETAQPLVGDKIIVRLTISSNDNVDYVHLKDMRSALLEPAETLSGYKYTGRLSYYQAVRDASVNFFIEKLPKGAHIIEYALRVRGKGVTSNGFATLQCMYAPEFESQSESCILHSK